jgi:hypothetical protein
MLRTYLNFLKATTEPIRTLSAGVTPAIDLRKDICEVGSAIDITNQIDVLGGIQWMIESSCLFDGLNAWSGPIG